MFAAKMAVVSIAVLGRGIIAESNEVGVIAIGDSHARRDSGSLTALADDPPTILRVISVHTHIGTLIHTRIPPRKASDPLFPWESGGIHQALRRCRCRMGGITRPHFAHTRKSLASTKGRTNLIPAERKEKERSCELRHLPSAGFGGEKWKTCEERRHVGSSVESRALK